MGIKQLTESLLTLARSDSGQETAVCAPVDLSFIVNSSLMTFEPLVFDMDKHIIYDIEASLHVNGDEKKLRQLSDILLDNACKYSLDKSSIRVTPVSYTHLTILLVSLPSGRAERKELKITIPENLDYSGIFDDIFEKYTKNPELVRVRTVNMGSLYELCYHVDLKSESIEKNMLDDIRCRNGNLTIVCGRLPDGREEL